MGELEKQIIQSSILGKENLFEEEVMNYPFECPKCGFKKDFNMRMSEYKEEGHYCEKCGAEMKREVSSLGSGMFVDKTNTFYRKTN